MVRKTDHELPNRLPNRKRDIGRNLSNKDNTKYNKKHQPEGIHANHRYDGRIRYSGKEMGVSKHPSSSSSKLRQDKFRDPRKPVREHKRNDNKHGTRNKDLDWNKTRCNRKPDDLGSMDRLDPTYIPTQGKRRGNQLPEAEILDKPTSNDKNNARKDNRRTVNGNDTLCRRFELDVPRPEESGDGERTSVRDIYKIQSDPKPSKKENSHDDPNIEGDGELPRNSNTNKRKSNRECRELHPSRVKNISRLNEINESGNKSKDSPGNEKVFKQRTETSKQTHSYQTENNVPKLNRKICPTICSRSHVSPPNTTTKIGIGICPYSTSNAKKGFRKNSEHLQIQNHEHSNSSNNRNGKYHKRGTKKTNEVHEPPGKKTKRSFSKATSFQQQQPKQKGPASRVTDRYDDKIFEYDAAPISKEEHHERDLTTTSASEMKYIISVSSDPFCDASSFRSAQSCF